MLLGVETQDANSSLINDNTVEGAVVLMEKIGYMIDEKLASLKASEEGGESGKGKKSEQADAGVKDKIIKTFARLNELASDTSVPPVSTRVKMLIKNMLENRA
jgi:VIT1/CCC1 family predicted Fe2+/Mn2+ transporter